MASVLLWHSCPAHPSPSLVEQQHVSPSTSTGQPPFTGTHNLSKNPLKGTHLMYGLFMSSTCNYPLVHLTQFYSLPGARLGLKVGVVAKSWALDLSVSNLKFFETLSLFWCDESQFWSRLRKEKTMTFACFSELERQRRQHGIEPRHHNFIMGILGLQKNYFHR